MYVANQTSLAIDECQKSFGTQRQEALQPVPKEIEMSGGFTLHGSPHSLPTYRIALMMRLSRTGFTFRYVSFQRGMHLTPEFRALSRWGQVPVLEHEGRVFVQSAAILEYLAETLGCFGAAGVEARQHIREWATLNSLEAHLSGHRFLVGDGATIADICCYGEVAFARLSNKDLAAWPNILAWAGRIEALPGFAAPFDLLAMQDAEIGF